MGVSCGDLRAVRQTYTASGSSFLTCPSYQILSQTASLFPGDGSPSGLVRDLAPARARSAVFTGAARAVVAAPCPHLLRFLAAALACWVVLRRVGRVQAAF
jgi:hypothetical protein